jgi:hypothetical protein
MADANDVHFAEALGALRAEAQASQRQREKLFAMVETLSHQVTELTAKVEALAERPQPSCLAARGACEPEAPAGHGKVVLGVGGGGALVWLFGDNVVEGIGRFAAAIRKVWP